MSAAKKGGKKGGSIRPVKSGIQKGKIKLGIDYEGMEKSGPQITETPNRNRIAHSIEIINSNNRLSIENNGATNQQ